MYAIRSYYASALVIAGTTGEPATMSDDEKKALLKFAVKQAAKRVPVITSYSIHYTKLYDVVL